jgi:5-methylcytosine-specific restriction endonuclease McrA
MIGTLRRASYRFPGRYNAFNAAKIGRNKYTCAKCKGTFGRKDTRIDHIEPVVEVAVGFVDWNTFIERLYCPQEGYQILCRTCHDEKTVQERELRVAARREKKKLDSKP